MHTSPFTTIYPDVDPRTTLPATAGERISLTVAVMVLTFGATAGDLLIGGTGLALTLTSILLITTQTARRIRSEARQRFPEQPWAEYDEAARGLRTEIAIPAAFALLTTAIAATLAWTPAEHIHLGAGLVTALAALIMLLLPGLSPIWTRRRRRG